MVGRAFIVNVAENALDRIGLRAIARQLNQFETGMLFQQAVDRFRFNESCNCRERYKSCDSGSRRSAEGYPAVC